MPRNSYFLVLLLLVGPMVGFAREVPDVDSPAFTSVPELSHGFDLLYQQRFAEAREIFANWESHNPDEPFGEVAVAASYLFEELYPARCPNQRFFPGRKEIPKRN